MDSVKSDQHEVIHFGVVGTDLIRLDTQLLYNGGDRLVYDESGMIIDTFPGTPEGTIEIQTLNYYS